MKGPTRFSTSQMQIPNNISRAHDLKDYTLGCNSSIACDNECITRAGMHQVTYSGQALVHIVMKDIFSL